MIRKEIVSEAPFGKKYLCHEIFFSIFKPTFIYGIIELFIRCIIVSYLNWLRDGNPSKFGVQKMSELW